MITHDDDDELVMWCVMEKLEIDLFKAITTGMLKKGKDDTSLFVSLLGSFVSALAYLHSPVSHQTCLFFDIFIVVFSCVTRLAPLFPFSLTPVHIEERYSEIVNKQVDKKPIVHRDLKPENIMLDKNNVLKVVDFGLAKETMLGVGSTMNVKGTKEWMAPEQVSKSSCLCLFPWCCLAGKLG